MGSNKKHLMLVAVGFLMLGAQSHADPGSIACPHMHRAAKKLLSAANQIQIRLGIDPTDEYALAAQPMVNDAIADVKAGLELRNCKGDDVSTPATHERILTDADSLQCFLDRPHRVSILNLLRETETQLIKAKHVYEGDRAKALNLSQLADQQMVSDLSDDSDCSLVIAPVVTDITTEN